MKLYAFQPRGHGELSFFTIAENDAQAIANVQKVIDEKHTKDGKLEFEARGWGTDYYEMTIVGVNGVICNDNE